MQCLECRATEHCAYKMADAGKEDLKNVLKTRFYFNLYATRGTDTQGGQELYKCYKSFHLDNIYSSMWK